MTRQECNALDDEALIWACVEPVVRQMRAKDPAAKAQTFRSLNGGQRALFLFQVLYGHAGQGMPEFVCQIGYLAQRLDFWPALKSAMRYFQDGEMLGIVEGMEAAYNEAAAQTEHAATLHALEERYCRQIPITYMKVAAAIRSNPTEFVQLAD